MRPGSTLGIKVTLGRVGGGPERVVNLTLDVPGDFRSGFLEVQGGSSEGFFVCFEEFGPCSSRPGKAKNFDDLIDSLEDSAQGERPDRDAHRELRKATIENHKARRSHQGLPLHVGEIDESLSTAGFPAPRRSIGE